MDGPRLLRSRPNLHPAIPAAIRVVVGAVFVVQSFGKFADTQRYVDLFEEVGAPLASISVPVVGLIELIGGLALIIGCGTRVAAVVLIALAVGILVTSGRVRTDTTSLVLAPLLAAGAVFLLWSGPGRWSLDEWIRRRST